MASANVGAYIGARVSLATKQGFVRPHLYLPLIDEAGGLLNFAQIRIYQQDGKTLYSGTLWRDVISASTWLNPHNVAPAIVDLYLDAPARVVIGYTTDQTKPEVLSGIIDVFFDPSESVISPVQIVVDDPVPLLSILSATGATTATWTPVKIAHQHAAVAGGTVRTGDIPLQQAQIGSFADTTTVGVQAGAPSVLGSTLGATMFGFQASAAAVGGVAIGAISQVTEEPVTPWTGFGVALGMGAAAGMASVAVGAFADGEAITDTGTGAIALGSYAAADESGVAVGPDAQAGVLGVALGGGTGSLSHGASGSIGLGWDAQYGLPSDTTGMFSAVLLGAHDPTVMPSFLWSNPHHSQSESWLDEFLPTMQFTGKTVQIQRHLQWVINAVALQVQGDCTLGGRGGSVGFYGHVPTGQVTVSDDEPGSGLPALDSLIFALRDLNLIGARTEAMMIYRAADLVTACQDDDEVLIWPEHRGRDVAVAVAERPVYSEDEDYNGYPAITFDNQKWDRWASEIEQFRGANLLPPARHFIVVAEHDDDKFGLREGLFNLAMPDGKPSPQAVVLTADPLGTHSWQQGTWTGYELDGLNQFSSRRTWLDPDWRHVYLVSNTHLWPHAKPIIAGPPDGTARSDSWSGSIAEVVGMDATWDTQHAHWMETGLQFLYNIHTNDRDFADPAEDFLVQQHDPLREVLIYWDHDDDCDDWFGNRVSGYIHNAPGSVISVPHVRIHETFEVFEYFGLCSGYWSGIDDWEVCEVVLICRDTDFDSDSGIEVIIGVYELNGNGTWSSGRDWCTIGFKRVIIREKITRVTRVISGTLPLAYSDLEVRVYTAEDSGHHDGDDGPLRLEDTVPLQGDGTFSARMHHHQRDVVARLYVHSTGTLVATTEYQLSTLPRTTIYASDDPDVTATSVDRANTYESALAALAFLGMSRRRWYRARRILANLMAVANTNGSLNESYSADLPGSGPTAPVGLRGCVWTILAVLRYEWRTGDTSYRSLATGLAGFLVSCQQGSGSLRDPDSGLQATAENAVAYFALRDLGLITGTSSYTTAATVIKASLLANHWTASPLPRWKRSINDDAEELTADVFGGLFAIAIGRWDRAHDTLRHLRRLRVTGASITTGHYTNTAKVLGYKPFGELGGTGFTNPPAIIDQAHTWAALLFKARYGEPIGQELDSLRAWQNTQIVNDPHDVLSYPQWLAYNQTVEANYHLRGRPYVGAAAWAVLLANGCFDLLTPDPAPAPLPINLAVTNSYDYSARRIRFVFTWTLDPTLPAAFFEAQPQYSTDGTTWTNLANRAISDQLSEVIDPTRTNGYASKWSVLMPANGMTTYRVQVRVRNTTFGTWVTSGSVGLPTVH